MIDFIYTATIRATCCMAAFVGIGYGVQSGNLHLCPLTDNKKHRVMFVDNEFKKYNHTKHLEVVKQLNPKYATVRDIMTQEQCEKEGIQYFSFEQIMEMAQDIEQYTENVIVIPKAIEYIEMIPEKYMLGYSVPTKYAGTPFDISYMSGRRIHILGGSWKKQLELIQIMPNEIVSLDNNHLSKITRYSQYIDCEGNSHSLSEISDIHYPNPMDICHALSLGAMAVKIKQINEFGIKCTKKQMPVSLFDFIQ